MNFKQPLLGLNGKPELKQGVSQKKGDEQYVMIDEILGELLGAQRTTGEVVAKLYGWHKTLLEGKELILDAVDKKKLIEIIQDSETYVYFKGQILEIIENSK